MLQIKKILTSVLVLFLSMQSVWASAPADFLMDRGVFALEEEQRVRKAGYYFEIVREVYGKYFDECEPVVQAPVPDNNYQEITHNIYRSSRTAAKAQQLPEKQKITYNEKKDDRSGSIAASLDKYTARSPETRGRRVTSDNQSQSVTDKSVTRKALKKIILDLRDMDINDYYGEIILYKDSELIIKSGEIKRFLAVDQNILNVQRIDPSSIKVTPKQYGKSFLHVWDEHGRWTFNVRVVVPDLSDGIKDSRYKPADGFTFYYNYFWSSYNTGESVTRTHRNSLSIGQTLSMIGPTPVGMFTGTLSWHRAATGDNKHFRTTKEYIKITDGHLFMLDDFTLTAFDINEKVSPYTLGGIALRGVSFVSPLFGDMLEYKIIYGREAGTYFGLQDVRTKRDSFITGVKVTYNPDEEDGQYSLNYATSHGTYRSDSPDKVVSVETKNKIYDDWLLKSETGFDETHTAFVASASRSTERSHVNLSARRVDKDYHTVTGTGGYAGEVGGRVNWSYHHPDSKNSYSGYLDAYISDIDYNPEHPHYPDVSSAFTFTHDIDNTSSVSSNVSVRNNQGSSLQSRYYNFTTRYSKRLPVRILGNERNLSTYIAYYYGRTVTPTSRDNDYRRDTIKAGLSLPITKSLVGNLSYERSRVTENYQSDRGYPRIITAGLSYYAYLNSKLTMSSSVYYRDENESDTVHSFVSGQDAVDYYINFSYSPNDQVNMYVDGSVHRIMSDVSDASRRVTSGVRLGTNITWDSFICWAPKTLVKGRVFVDENGNKIYDPGEFTLPDVRINVGNRSGVTDDEGLYGVKIRARSALVEVFIPSLPAGHIVSTDVSVSMDTSGGGVRIVDFPISVRSGITGAVFYDVNGNGEFDGADTPMGRIKLVLDKKIYTRTNAGGIFFFSDLAPGKHTVMLDIASIPQEYLPMVKARQDFEVIKGLSYKYNVPLKKKQ